MTSNSTSLPMALPSTTAVAHLHISDAQWANFWAKLLFRYQQKHPHSDSNSINSFDSIPSTSQSSSPFSLAPLNFAIALTELVLDLLAILPNLYFIFLLSIRRDLHNNLRILLGSFSFCLISISVTRIPTQLNYICTGVLYIDAFRWLVFGHEIGVMFFRTIIVPLTIERVLATLRSKNYEQQKSPLIGILAVLLTFVLSTGIGLYIGHELNASHISQDGIISFQGQFYGLYHVIDVSLRLLIWLVCFAIFVALFQYNQRCYAFARLPNKHTLVQRYQFAENVRSSRLLLVIGIILFVCNLHFDFIMIRIGINKDHFDVEYSQSFDFVLALALNSIPIAAIWFHSSMFSASKSHAKLVAHYFANKFCCRQSKQMESEQMSNLLSTKKGGGVEKSPRALLSGQKLIVRRNEEQQVYFEELMKSWNENVQKQRQQKGNKKGRRATWQLENDNDYWSSRKI